MLLARHPLILGIALVVALSPLAVRADDAPAEATADDAGRTLATIEVVGNHQERKTAEGTASVLDQSVIVSGRALTVNEALRKVPGVTVRDEEGFGLRPNIGIRGSNPTRSTKVLLLEDGLPAMYAPYGDNASYYHAPIQRYVPAFQGAHKDSVTVRHLLTHSSGLPGWRPLYQLADSRAAAMALADTTPLDTLPGARMVYSDLGIIVMTQALEGIYGKRLDALFREKVTTPFGMPSSGRCASVASLVPGLPSRR